MSANLLEQPRLALTEGDVALFAVLNVAPRAPGLGCTLWALCACAFIIAGVLVCAVAVCFALLRARGARCSRCTRVRSRTGQCWEDGRREGGLGVWRWFRWLGGFSFGRVRCCAACCCASLACVWLWGGGRGLGVGVVDQACRRVRAVLRRHVHTCKTHKHGSLRKGLNKLLLLSLHLQE